MRFILEGKIKLRIKDVKLKNFEDWCLDDKKRCLDEICYGGWKETDQGIIANRDVWLDKRQLKQIPFKFYIVGASFYIDNNLLTSLINSPRYVRQGFYPKKNKLQNLIGGAINIEWSYNVSNNQINSLEGAPEYVGMDFWISDQEPPGKDWTEKEIREKVKVLGVVVT